VYAFVKHGLLPGTIGLLLLGVLFAFLLARRPGTRCAGLVVAIAFVAVHWAISMPVGAWLVGRVVSSGYEPLELAGLAGVAAIVVLDGGAARYNRGDEELALVTRISAVRALEAARLYRALQPPLVVVTGGTYVPRGGAPEGGALRGVLLQAGVPAERIELDTTSRNTREHAVNVSKLLKEKGIRRFALVTSAVHMRRAMRAFSATGTEAVPAPAPLELPERFPWWPSVAGLDRSYEALYELFGLLRDVVQRAEQ